MLSSFQTLKLFFRSLVKISRQYNYVDELMDGLKLGVSTNTDIASHFSLASVSQQEIGGLV